MKALIADDTEIMRSVLAQILTNIGFDEVEQVDNGMAAVMRAGSGGIDLILMDNKMPKMGGIEAVKAIREKGDQTPIIMVTVESDRSNIITAVQAGANDYVLKPLEKAILAEKIKKLMGDKLGAKSEAPAPTVEKSEETPKETDGEEKKEDAGEEAKPEAEEASAEKSE